MELGGSDRRDCVAGNVGGRHNLVDNQRILGVRHGYESLALHGGPKFNDIKGEPLAIFAIRNSKFGG